MAERTPYGVNKPSEAEIVVRARGGPRSLFAGLPPGDVLDVPAGGGLQTETLVKQGFRVCSIDLFQGHRQGAVEQIISPLVEIYVGHQGGGALLVASGDDLVKQMRRLGALGAFDAVQSKSSMMSSSGRE